MIDKTRWTVGLRGVLALALSLALAGCDFFDGGGDEAVPPPALVADSADPTYAAVDGGAGASVEIFGDVTKGEAAETLYANPASGERVRVFNSADGTPLRVYDEVSRNSLTITATSAERVDYRAYDRDGNYTGGYALVARSDGLFVATILGSPSFVGQIAGQLVGANQTGSYALTPVADAGLGTPVAVSAQAQALAAAATPALATAQRARAAALLPLDARAVVAGLAMGVTVGSGSAPALAAGAMTAYALQRIGLQVFGGADIVSTFAQLADVLNTLFDRFNRGSAATASLAEALAGVSVPRIQGATLRTPGRDVRSPRLDPSTLPPATALPPAADTAVSGSGVDQSNTSYALSGVVSAARALQLTMSDLAGGAGIDIVATLVGDDVSGTMSGRLGAGSVTGRRGDPGPCATLQQSGGQGTFSYAFLTGGATGGSFDFYREAYTIPDGFRVVSNNQTLYDTHGPVSGNETAALTLVGSATLFVNVSAPSTGTQWQFIVGCPS